MSLLTPWQNAWQFISPQAIPARSADWRLVAEIQQQAAPLERCDDSELRQRADGLRHERAIGAANSLAPAASLISEAIRRVLGLRLFDEQLLAGLAMARGAIVEMQTGEGKTLSAAVPAFVHGLSRRGVHVVTQNAYLAERDWQLLRPVFALLGVSSGLVVDKIDANAKRGAYNCDITYGPGYEFGFDFLRDRLARAAENEPAIGQTHRELLRAQTRPAANVVQRGHAVAIIDEIDSVLLDEACTPLVISAAPPANAQFAAAYCHADQVATALRADVDYHVDYAKRAARLTESGQCSAQAAGSVRQVGRLERPWLQYVEQALHARRLLERDIDYVVERGQVLLVDETTGRVFADRSWRGGLHQAVQAKEGLEIQPEAATAARVSRQRYFQLYTRLCGMTGTTTGGEREFWSVYRLPVVVLPPRKPGRRSLLPTRFFATSAARARAVLAEVLRVSATGRPVLIGARTIENSLALAESLQAAGVHFRLLNGVQDADEAAIIAEAGRRGAITIATNMAGRGADIKLGIGVAELGGLHLIGVERNDLERVDRQLIGRVGRQGDPGSCQFLVSADDVLVRRLAPELVQPLTRHASLDGETGRDFSHEITAAQRRHAADGYEQRRRLLAYDRWLDEFGHGGQRE